MMNFHIISIILIYFCTSYRGSIASFELNSAFDEVRVSQENLLDNYGLWLWTKTHLDWLSEEQKSKLNDLIAGNGTLDDFHKAVMEMYSEQKGEALWVANNILNNACTDFIDYLTKPSTFYHNELVKIQQSARDLFTTSENNHFVEKTRKRIGSTMDQILAKIKPANRRKTAEKFLGSCAQITLSKAERLRHYVNTHEFDQHYLLLDSDVQNWTRLYLSWFSEAEKTMFNLMIGDGASIQELRDLVEKYYSSAIGVRHIQATKSLSEGCTAFFTFLLDKDAAENFIAFIKGMAVLYESNSTKEHASGDDIARHLSLLQEHRKILKNEKNMVIDAIKNDNKKRWAKNHLHSCVTVFDTAFRKDWNQI